MELSAPPRSLPSLLRRPFVPTISPLLLVSSRRLPNKSLLASRSPKSVPGLNRSIGRPLRATASGEEASTTVVADYDTPKRVVGPSVLVNSSSAEEDVPDEGGEQISEASDDLLPKLNLKVLSSPSASDEETSTTVVAGDDTPKPVVGPSFLMNSSSAEEDVPDEGGEQISEVADDLLSKLNLKMDLEDTYTILFYGAGTLVTLLILSAIISSIDSVPLFSKAMEVFGLGFTVWFSFRYLIYKENRDELVSKLDDLKQKIVGPSDN
ncbi:uncharacterized protein LOC103991532 isoform X2 [Musa acuminata AAA Group]|uniref:uncharacterized protein LOC103991532 isoform X2 n=1 Tax=Musa acuminata AAA Group TaxID=214697 RepID=UPI0031D1AF22